MTSKKHNRTHPYAAIDHRVMDSPNYQNLTHSSQSLLLILARQLNGKNNGHLQASFSFASKYGHKNERTLSRSLKELLRYRFIFQTKVGGYTRGVSMFAVTWLPIQDNTGIYANGFEILPWRPIKKKQDVKSGLGQDAKTPAEQEPENGDGLLKKTSDVQFFTGAKTPAVRLAKWHATPLYDAKTPAETGAKTPDYVSIPISGGIVEGIEHNGHDYVDYDYSPF